MLDSDLARIYGVPTFRLNEQIKRNRRRFPDDFMLQLNKDEARALRSQFAILKPGGRGQHRKYLPYAFTEQGVAMLSTVLNSERAIQVNIAIMRAFVKLRETLSLHKELAVKFQKLEQRIMGHDAEIRNIFDAIEELRAPPHDPPRRIGFGLE